MHAAYRHTSATHRLVPFSPEIAAETGLVRPSLQGFDTAAAAQPRYGDGKRPNWVVAGVLALVHLVLLFALVKLDVIPLSKPAPKPIIVELIETPEMAEPPPPRAEPTPPDVKPPLVAPQPLIVPPAPSPSPMIAVIQPPKIEAVAAPRAVDGPPVTPPDFSADYLNNPPPRYPVESRHLREQGTVTVKVLVTPEGAVQELKLAESSGHSRLDKAAMAAIRNWRFAPAKQAGKAVAAWVIVPIPFVLRA